MRKRPIRVLYLGNNWLGQQILGYLLQHDGTDVVGVVKDSTLELPSGPSWNSNQLKDPEALKQIAILRPDIGVSVLYSHILKPAFLDLFPLGVINLHPSLLPYNRGQYPNVWSIVERTPAGVTLHYVDDGIDTGGIICQREVSVSLSDTGQSLYWKLMIAGLAMLCEEWPKIIERPTPLSRKQEGPATYHRTEDVQKIDCIDLDEMYRAGDLINILRARTFAPYRGAYFMDRGKKVYMELHLSQEE